MNEYRQSSRPRPKRSRTHPAKLASIPGSGSSNFSFNRGKAGRRDSGYFRNTLYMISTAFFRMYGLVWDIWDGGRARANEGACQYLPTLNTLNEYQLNALLTDRPPQKGLTKVMMSLARSRARSGVTKQESPVSATPVSYWLGLLRSCWDKASPKMKTCNALV